MKDKATLKETIANINTEIKNCVENWHGGWGRRRVIQVRSGFTDIDALFSMAEIVNDPIQNLVMEWAKAVYPSDQSVDVKQGPVKRPGRAIAYVFPSNSLT